MFIAIMLQYGSMGGKFDRCICDDHLRGQLRSKDKKAPLWNCGGFGEMRLFG